MTENPNGNAVKDKPKRDLTAAYFLKCDKETDLAEKRFKWEQDCFNKSTENHDKELQSKNRQEVILKCIVKSYSPGTINRYVKFKKSIRIR